MGLLDHQIGFVKEATYGTPLTPTRFFEFESESIESTFARVETEPLRVGNYVNRTDRFTPYYAGAAGSVEFAVLTKDFSYLLEPMLGTVITTGPTDSAYTHTGTMGPLTGKSLTCQIGRPLNPSGTVQPFTFEGGKVTEFTFSNSVEEALMLELGLDFEQVSTATGLAAATYPTGSDLLSWVNGSVKIAGVDAGFCVNEVAVTVSNNMNVDRRCINGGPDKKEPTEGRREISFTISGDFGTLAERNRAASATAAGAIASLEFKWNGSTTIGAGTLPSLTITLPNARFDGWSAAIGGTDAITQELSGVALLAPAGGSPISIAAVNSVATQ